MTRFVDPMQRRTPTSLMKCNRTTNQRAELPKSGGVWCGWVGVAVAVGQKSGVLADGRFERLIMSRAGLTPVRDIINLSKWLPAGAMRWGGWEGEGRGTGAGRGV